MSATPGIDLPTGIGVRLKAGRERAAMTLLQVAEKLHVDPKVLESLEAERFDLLGAPVYARGHLKRYSELVGENTTELLDIYAAATKPVFPDLTKLPKASRVADPKKLLLPSLVVLIAFALVGTVWWVLQNFNSKVTFGKPATPQAVPETSDVTEAPVVSSEAPGVEPQVASTPAVGAPHMKGPAAPAASVASPAGAAANRARTAAGQSAANVPAPAPAAGTQNTQGDAGTAATEPTPRGRAMNVTLKFAADSWVEVYDAKGERLFYDIGSANSSRTLSGTPPLRVVLGNAPGVSLNVNGKTAVVPASAMHDDGAQFVINRSGRIVRARPDAAAAPASKANGE